MIRVRLLERAGCGLCAEAHAALQRLARRRDLAVERIDVGDDPHYLLRVPVLAVDERELDAAGLEEGGIARWLDEVAP